MSTTEVKEDKRNSHVGMVNLDGTNDRQVTSSQESESSPRWSRDGKYLAFTSSRPGAAKGNQVWLLDRSGGEAAQLTDVKGRLQDFEWSPDSKRLAIVMGDPDPEADQAGAGGDASKKVPKPIVIDRYKYKQDGQGYLLSNRHSYIYLFDIAAKKLERLTKGKADESSPSWSPDGAHCLHEQPERRSTVSLHPALHRRRAERVGRKGAESDRQPRRARQAGVQSGWQVDRVSRGRREEIRRLRHGHLAIVAADGATPPQRVAASEALDRGVSQPRWGDDGKNIFAIVADDMSAYGAHSDRRRQRFRSPTSRSSSGRATAGSCAVAMSGDDNHPNEVYSATSAGGKLKVQPSHTRTTLFAELQPRRPKR